MNLDIIRNPQLILQDGKPSYAVVPYDVYSRFLEAIEDQLDLLEFAAVNDAIESQQTELVPAHVVYALLDGQNPIKVWREYRQITQVELANQIGISKAFMSQIESGTRSGEKHLASIAAVLQVDVDDLSG